MMLQKLLILTAWLIWNIIQSSASLWEHPSSLSMGFGRFIWPYSLLCYLKHSFLPFLFDPPKYEFFSFLLFFTHSINTCWIATFCIVKRQYRLLRSVNLGCYSLTFFSPLTPIAFYTVSFCWSLAALITCTERSSIISLSDEKFPCFTFLLEPCNISYETINKSPWIGCFKY